MKLKTHLIVKDIHEEYHINWCGRLIDSNPLLENGYPIFVIVGGNGRIELNTIDIKRIEKVGKLMTHPRGRESITTDKARVYIKEVSGNEKLVCIITHNHVKQFAPMYDEIEYYN